MKRTITLIIVALLLNAWSATVVFAGTPAQKKVEEIAARTSFRTGAFSVLAVKVNGDTVACYNHIQKMVPASNMKLITTGVALLELGEDFRFETSLGYSGTVKDGTLVGDLYIIGGADPTTGSASPSAEPLSNLFGKWTKFLKDAGIRRIDGRVIADPRFFKMQSAESNGWSYEDIGTYYGAGPKGLNFYENAQHFFVAPAAAVGEKTFARPRYPETPWMTLVNSSVTSKANTSNTLYYVNTGFGPYGEIRGCFPVNGRGATLECDNEFGAFTCAYYFARHLVSAGMEITGAYGDISPQGYIRTDLHYSEYGMSAAPLKDLTILGTTYSPALRDIVSDTNKTSDNFYAETLMHMVGKKLEGSPEYDSCYVAFSKVLGKIGIKTGESCKIYDGSGLSRKNYVSANFFVTYLKAMTRTSVYPVFLESLPNPTEKKTTLSGMLGKYPDEFRSRIRCKSGSMNGVRCYSGYILPSSDDPKETIVVSILTNNITAGTSSVSSALQEVLAAIASEN